MKKIGIWQCIKNAPRGDLLYRWERIEGMFPKRRDLLMLKTKIKDAEKGISQT